MNINNIALVRATNIIPFDGVIHPISNTPYLTKNIGTNFAHMIDTLLKEIGIISPIDFTKINEEDYFVEKVKQDSQILKNYLPYTSDYNSTVLFSLNGLCPDDDEHGFGNNIFSNKKCCIIEPLTEHIQEVVSLLPTDTCIKGDVTLSKDAIILIEKEKYKTLSNEEKESLKNLNLSVRLFQGSLRETVEDTLKETNRYIPEQLTLTRKDGGFKTSPTSKMHKELIQNIAEEYQIPQVLYYNILTKNNDNLDQLTSMNDELNNVNLIIDYYEKQFMIHLLTQLNAPDAWIEVVPNNITNKAFLTKITEYIKTLGIDIYKTIVDQYNNDLNLQRTNYQLLTPQQIVDKENEIKQK